jgi:hypothetical protein
VKYRISRENSGSLIAEVTSAFKSTNDIYISLVKIDLWFANHSTGQSDPINL